MYDRRIEELLDLASCFLKAKNAFLRKILTMVKKDSLTLRKKILPPRERKDNLG